MEKRKKIKLIFLSICFTLIANAGLVKSFPVDGNSLSNAENSVQQQSITVSGAVKDANGEPLIGVSVIIAGTKTGTVTNLNGEYSVDVPGKNSELLFTYMGFKPQSVKVNGQKKINVTLTEQINELEDVVIIAYGVQKKESVVGSLSTISTKDLLQSPQANISNALAGRLPGLIAVQRSGQPGKDASTLRIRGIGTFAEKNKDRPWDPDPQDPLVMIDGIESSNFNDIDPSEIESLTILKDASATAVYGVRGANGVILITTRRGSEGKPRISFSTNVAVTNFPFLRKNQTSYDYVRTANEALKYDSYVTGSYAPRFSDYEIEQFRLGTDPVNYPSTDWYDYLLRDFGYQTQSNFNVSGGTDAVKYFVSLGYFTQYGMFNTSVYDPGYDYQAKYKRYNLRTNFDVNIIKNLKISFDISTQIGDIRDPNWSMGGLFEGLSSGVSFSSPKIMDNHIVTNKWGMLPPMTPFDKGWNRTYDNTLNGSFRANYKMDYLLKGLSLRSAFSYKNYNQDKKTFNMQGMNYSAVKMDDGNYIFLENGEPAALQTGWGIEKNTRIYLEAGVDYMKQFGYHTLTGLLLYNQTKYYDPHLQYHIPNGYQGIVSRVTYNFRNRYMAEVNIGYNGTENFAKGKRFGLFPAYSLGWSPTEESFFPENNIVSYIKFRGSYGVVGNDKIGGDRFLYLPTTFIRPNEQYHADGNTSAYYWGEHGSSQKGYYGYIEGKIGNPNLTWEKAGKMNIGTDMKFWKDRISLTVDYFEEKRDNILWNMGTIPAIIGATMPAYNLGKTENKGWDGEISFNNRIGTLAYFVKANYTYAHNKVIYKDEVARSYDYLYETGHRVGQFFGFVANGIYNTWEEVNDVNRPVYQWSNNKIQPGDIRYVDVNGDGYIDNNDRVPIGYSNIPEVIFGISLGGEWKGFDFSMLFQGADKVSNMPSRRTIQGYYNNTGANSDLLKSWTQERYEQGMPIVYPRYAADYGSHNYQWSTYWLEDASYVRLKNAEIGYTFRSGALKKVGIGSVRLYANGSNLITWCDMFPGEDPEFPIGENNSEPYPLTRIFNLGLNVSF
ncbi:MAG: TonB-dependent receptor [Dysgonamonadaceae bacterium]|jgi:TonB-linked SusC/RagA family outer membrane protein|nr:TonB-dependent receptor [Dysgonamonadaceae bacterium]